MRLLKRLIDWLGGIVTTVECARLRGKCRGYAAEIEQLKADCSTAISEREAAELQKELYAELTERYRNAVVASNAEDLKRQAVAEAKSQQAQNPMRG